MNAVAVREPVTPFPIRALRLGILAMILLMAASIALTWRVGENIRHEMRAQVNVITAAQKIDHYGTVLEISIKAVVANGDAEAAARYRSVQPALRETLSDLRRSLHSGQHGDVIDSVNEADLKLITIEHQALDLASKGEIDAARELVHSQRYDYLVNIYQEGVQSIEESAAQFVNATKARLDFYLWAIILLSGTSLMLVLVG